MSTSLTSLETFLLVTARNRGGCIPSGPGSRRLSVKLADEGLLEVRPAVHAMAGDGNPVAEFFLTSDGEAALSS